PVVRAEVKRLKSLPNASTLAAGRIDKGARPGRRARPPGHEAPGPAHSASRPREAQWRQNAEIHEQTTDLTMVRAGVQLQEVAPREPMVPWLLPVIHQGIDVLRRHQTITGRRHDEAPFPRDLGSIAER